MTALYLHIPFCKSRCIYCDFFSSTEGDATKARFSTALCSELATRSEEALGDSISTIYFGGGTPSQLSVKQLQQIFESIHAHYAVEADAEITLEANPEDIDADYVHTLTALGVNRLSLGVQSFDDHVLQTLRRRHNAEHAKRAVHTVFDCGISNISIDLMYGLPHQTMTEWTTDLHNAFKLPISHLSAYALTFEQDTMLWRMLKDGIVCETDDETSREMYETLCQCAAAEGFEHYEISNFCKTGHPSRHNSSYWNGSPYIGVGPGAHSYDGQNVRRWNASNLSSYCASEGQPEHTLEILSEDEKYNDFIFTALRTQRGVDLQELKQRFGADRLTMVNKIAERHLKAGLIEKRGSHLQLTGDAIFTSDDIISDYICVE